MFEASVYVSPTLWLEVSDRIFYLDICIYYPIGSFCLMTLNELEKVGLPCD